jgi:hypothetical protein
MIATLWLVFGNRGVATVVVVCVSIVVAVVGGAKHFVAVVRWNRR